MASQDGILHFKDASGNTLEVLSFRGRIWPAFSMESIRGVETFKARDDDVVLVAYPKSGTHWIWEVTRLLLAGTVDVPELEKDVGMIEDVHPDDLQALPSPRSLNTHSHFELMPPEVMSNRKCKLIYVTRDPRDLAVSYYHHHRKLVQYYHYKGEWKDYLPMFLAGKVDYESWFAYTKGWEQGIQDNPDLQVHVTSYEAFHENTADEVKRLAKFLDTTADASLVGQIIRKASFDNMRSTKGASESFEGNGPSSPVMYRKGKVGDWKNWFTVAQSELFDEVFEREMQGTKAYQLYSRLKQDTTRPDSNMNKR